MTEQIIVGNADIVTAFAEQTIGTKVLDRKGFDALLLDAIANTDFAKQDIPGQAFIKLNESVVNMLSPGVATRNEADQPEDFVIRRYREGCKMYLRRSVAEAQGRNKATGGAIVVYTAPGYLGDPDLQGETTAILNERQRVIENGYTHILVAVLGFSGPDSPLTPFRFVHNLAGGNREAQIWSASKIRRKTKEIIEFANSYVLVAD
mgnify:FL=1